MEATSAGSVVGLISTPADALADPINEWGFYDPDVAGFGALMATLDTSAIPPSGQVDESPGELLLRQQAPAQTKPTRVLAPHMPDDPPVETRRSSAASAVAACRVGHLAPLSLWARLGDGDAQAPVRSPGDHVGRLLSQWMPKHVSRRANGFASSDLAGAIGQLTHPAHVAMTGLSPACRIRGIRIPPDVVTVEPAEELPGWPQPSTHPIPDAIAIEARRESAPDTGESVRAAVAPAPDLGTTVRPDSFDRVQQADVGLTAPGPAEFRGDSPAIAVEPPAIDALPMDCLAEPSPGPDIVSFETVAFDCVVPAPSEPEPEGETNPATHDSMTQRHDDWIVEAATAVSEPPARGTLDDSTGCGCPASEPVNGQRAFCDDAGSKRHAESHDEPDALTPDVASNPAGRMCASEVSTPSVQHDQPIPSQSVQAPAKKRRRTALALG